MSHSFAERLVAQRLRLRERESDIETQQESLALKEKLIAKLQETLTAAQEELAKAEDRRKTVEKIDDATEAAYAAAKKVDEEARAALAAECQGDIDAVNTELQAMGPRENKASRLNSTYKQQIEIYSQRSEVGETKFDDYMKQRDDKVAEVKAKQERDAASIPAFTAELETEMELLAEARTAHDAVRAKVDVYLERFASIQLQLDASKKTYETSKDEKERLFRTMRAVESDKAMVIKRAEHSRDERNKQLAKVHKLEEQLEAAKAQTERLVSMCAMFENPQQLAAADKAAE